MNNKTQH